MNRTLRAGLLAVLGCCVGCAMFENQQLENERKRLQSANDESWQSLDRLAPVGSRWASHRDTQTVLSDVKSNDARIREIDERLAR